MISPLKECEGCSEVQCQLNERCFAKHTDQHAPTPHWYVHMSIHMPIHMARMHLFGAGLQPHGHFFGPTMSGDLCGCLHTCPTYMSVGMVVSPHGLSTRFPTSHLPYGTKKRSLSQPFLSQPLCIPALFIPAPFYPSPSLPLGLCRCQGCRTITIAVGLTQWRRGVGIAVGLGRHRRGVGMAISV